LALCWEEAPALLDQEPAWPVEVDWLWAGADCVVAVEAPEDPDELPELGAADVDGLLVELEPEDQPEELLELLVELPDVLGLDELDQPEDELERLPPEEKELRLDDDEDEDLASESAAGPAIRPSARSRARSVLNRIGAS